MINKKLILTENQFKQLIKEELGISEEVANMAISVYEQIENNKEKDEVESNDYFSKWVSSLKFNFLNCKVNCSITYYNYFSNEYYQYSNIVSTGWSVYVTDKLFFMGIIVPMVSGNIVKDEVIDTIQHELSHIYEQKMMGKQYSQNKVYSSLKTNMYSDNEIVNKAANLVYGCIKSEQDGFVNGLYAYLMSQPELFSIETLKKSECWKLYEKMVSIYNENSNDSEFISELKKYKFTLNKVDKLINNFITKIGRVIVKVKQDKYKKQGFREKN